MAYEIIVEVMIYEYFCYRFTVAPGAPDRLCGVGADICAQARILKISFLEFNFTFLIQIKACSHHCEHRWTLFDANIKDPSTQNFSPTPVFDRASTKDLTLGRQTDNV